MPISAENIWSAVGLLAVKHRGGKGEAQQAAQELMDALGRAGYVNIKKDTDANRMA